jgi:hypothetical protein
VRRRTAWLTATAVAAALALLTLAGVVRGERPAGSFDRVHSDFDPVGVREFQGFPLYWAGDSHDGLRLTAITRRRPQLGRDSADYVSFLYGDCRPPPGSGCALPLEIQTWPACVRTLADYRLTPFSDDPLPHETLTVRRVPGAFFRESPTSARLELYTGVVTVVLFGTERERLLAAADAIRGVNVEAGAEESLPPPVPGALEGKLTCSAATTG